MSNEWLIVVDGKALTQCSMKISVLIMAWSNTCYCTIHGTLFLKKYWIFFLNWCRSACAGEWYVINCWNVSVWDFTSPSFTSINCTSIRKHKLYENGKYSTKNLLWRLIRQQFSSKLSCLLSILCIACKLFWKHRNSNVENSKWMIWIHFCSRPLIWMELFYWNSLWTIRYVCYPFISFPPPAFRFG